MMERSEFDEIVTGRLTHLTIWMEDGLVEILCDFFLGKDSKIAKRNRFKRLMLFRDGFSVQDKIDLLKTIVSESELPDTERNLIKKLLEEVQEFKSFRNALAHGRDVSSEQQDGFSVEIVTRAGKEKTVVIDRLRFEQLDDQGNDLIAKLEALRARSGFTL